MRRVLLTTILLLATAPAAAVASPEAIYDDCQDGRIDGTYSQKDFREAQRDIPADLDEYTNCRELIRRAQVGTAASGARGTAGGDEGAIGGGALGGGAPPPALNRNDPAADPLLRSTLDERAIVAEARGGPSFDPSAKGARPAGAIGGELPAGLIALLAATAIAGLGVVVPRLWSLARPPSPA